MEVAIVRIIHIEHLPLTLVSLTDAEIDCRVRG